jgi:mannose-6-phosphate isomerase-like protein (cupin superfamily)
MSLRVGCMPDVVNGCSVFAAGDAEGLLTIEGAETGGAFSAIMGDIPAGMPAPPMHVHPNTDEAFFVAEGEAAFKLGDREVSAGPGSLVFVPRATVHTAWNAGSNMLRGIIFITPGDAEHDFVPVEGD